LPLGQQARKIYPRRAAWRPTSTFHIRTFGLPSAVKNGLGGIVQWIAQTFLQLVLLSIIIVGQNVQAEASDKRAESTYQDAEAVLHEALQIQEHLLIQDQELQRLRVQLV
jgi:hypothetical protein